jgi:hypothetical protein
MKTKKRRNQCRAGLLPRLGSFFKNDEAKLELAFRDADAECRKLGLHRQNYFLRMIHEIGAIKAAQKLLDTDKKHDGLEKLRQIQRLDLSVEAIVLRLEFQHIFSEGYLATARKRLEEEK